MRIVVLGSPQSWYFSDLRRAAGQRHELAAVPFRFLQSTIRGDVTSVTGQYDNSHDPDAILVRTMPAASLEQVVFRMDALASLEANGIPVVNPPKAMEVAVDKYLASVRLQKAGLNVPATWCGQSAEDAMGAFQRLGGDVVVKPLFGGEGRGITRINDEALALRAFKMLEQMAAVIYLQEFIPHDGADLRLLVIGRRVLGIRRSNDEDWRTNMSRGAQAHPLEVTSELGDLAQRAAAAVGAPLAGIDLLPAKDGQLYALEVNAVPGWRAVARTLHVDVADLVLRFVESAVE